jgi:molybdate transport system regulatory protein
LNRLRGQILSVRTHQGTSLVECGTPAGTLTSVVLDTPESAPWLVVGQELSLLFKESEVWMLPGGARFIPHCLKGEVESIHEGELLARVACRTDGGRVTSLVDRDWLARLALSVGDAIDLGVHPAAVALQKEDEA